MSLQNLAEQYFGKLNPIAKRLYQDINETKAAYDKLWIQLSEEEQEQIINESIIKPEARLQYTSVEDEVQELDKFAMKTIVDDNCSYRDEHSAPFCFRTPSQRDLRIFGIKKETPKIKEHKNIKKDDSSDSCDIKQLQNHIDEISFDNNSVSTIPKTGLDLLDNW